MTSKHTFASAHAMAVTRTEFASGQNIISVMMNCSTTFVPHSTHIVESAWRPNDAEMMSITEPS